MLALVSLFALCSTGVALSQETSAPVRAVTPLKVQVVIARYQGEKKVSSLPYTLSMNATADPRSGKATLRMGAKVPVAVTAFGAQTPAVTPYQYQDVGTNIDCSVVSLEDGRFRLEITVDDSSVYPDEQSKESTVKGVPSFRSFRASDQLVLKDGATAQFTAATDKVNGEVVRVEVTLTVVK
jgi:hypothetical protein